MPHRTLLSALLLTAATAASGGEITREYSVTVTVDATEVGRQGQDWAKTVRKQRYEFSTRVKSDGELSDYNPKDPAEAQRQMALAGAVQRKAQAAQSRSPRPEAPPRSLEQFAAEAQQAQAACAGNTQCLMQLATRLSSPEAQAQLQAATAAAGAQQCATITDAAQRQACVAATSGAAPPKPAGQDDEALLNQTREPRYLQFFGEADCPSRLRVSIDDRTEGAYADVQGMVPYSIEQKAEWSGDDNTRALLCVSYNPVLDTRANQIWFDTVGLPAARGSYSRTERGRTERNDNSEMSLPSGVGEWVNNTLRQGPPSGTRSVVLPIRASSQLLGTVEGQAKVTATWSFK